MGYEDPAAPDLRWFWVGWGPRMGGTASGCETGTVPLPRLRSEDASYSQFLQPATALSLPGILELSLEPSSCHFSANNKAKCAFLSLGFCYRSHAAV